MDEWTVVLKTPTGFDFEIVEADYAEWVDDDKFLEFRNVAAGKEALEILANFRMNPTPDQLRAFVVGLFRAAGQLTVASFERESVAGYFRGRRATLDVRLEQKD